MMNDSGVPKIWYNGDYNVYNSYPTFLRMAIDTMDGYLDAYRVASQNGIACQTWRDALEAFGEFLLNAQNDDGSYYRCYNWSGTVYKNGDNGIPEPEGGLTFIEHVGEVPEEFKKIVEDNLFSGAEIYGDILLTYRNGENRDLIRILDKAGNILGEIVIDDPLSYLSQFIQCSDGNFLAVVTTRIMTESGSLTTYIKLVKFDSRGKVIFNCDYQGYSTEVFRDIVEVDDGYIFIGIRYVKTTASKRSQIDIAAIKLSADGKVENYIEFGGNDHDTVRYIEKTENGIRLYFVMREQGEEKTSSFQKYDLDSHLNITKRTEITEEEIPDDDKPWFTIDGKPYYHYEDFFEDYDRKKTLSYTVIEYDDFVIATYSRFTSTMTFPEHAISSSISPLSYYTERVYAAYTKQGKLIWRTAFDTSNYEFIKELLDKQNKN
jgi:hypothetical protein